MKPQPILFFADRLPPCIGGMEMHARYFIEYFTNHPQFPLSAVITKNTVGQDCVISQQGRHSIELKQLVDLFDPAFIFFNSGRWIEELESIRGMFPKASFLYRTGGNEILKAPLIRQQIPIHSLRQSYWVKTLNDSLDLLITNSAYTETRLREIGMTCPFARCVGGVNTSAFQFNETPSRTPIKIFCAARFVSYKNHALLLSVIHQLVLRGHRLCVRLAGDGPLLAQMQEQVVKNRLMSVVEFLGILDNEQIGQEIARAHLYMQFSTDQVIEVPGGSYVHAEGMGRSILEALTAGTFIIAGRSGALPEIVTEDRGMLIESNNLEKITDQIEQVLNKLPDKRGFTDEFSWTSIFKRYEELLEKCK